MGNRDPYVLQRLRKSLNIVPGHPGREKADLPHTVASAQEHKTWGSRTVDDKCPGPLTSFLAHSPPPRATCTSS